MTTTNIGEYSHLSKAPQNIKQTNTNVCENMGEVKSKY